MKNSFLIALFSLFLVNQLSAQNFYDRATVQTIKIYFASSNWDAILDAATQTDAYVMADSVVINGVAFDSVGVKYKGNSSYNANNSKNPFHIELNYIKGKQDYQGYTDIKLQNGFSDPSMIREVLSYAILEQYMDCPKANFANVYVNGSLRGIYSSAEDINDRFNGEHYYSTDGSFFKCNPVGGAGPGSTVSPDLKYINADSTSYYNGYELKSDYGWKNLVGLIDTLNNNFSEIEKVLDVDRALWMLAFNNVLVNLDSYSGAFRQNYYLYHDLNDRFVSTIWDLNMSFAGFPGGTGSGAYTATSLDPLSNSTSNNHPLIKKMLADPMYKRMYMAHLRTIVQETFATQNFVTMANAIRSTIDASVQADPYKFYTYTQYQNSLTTAVTGGGGPGPGSSIPGIKALMDARVTYFNTNANYILSAPTISNVGSSVAAPNYGQTVTIKATCTNESTVMMGYRFEHPLKFTRVPMYDDGNHNDGAAGDHVYGAAITLNATTFEYYIYAENTNAGLFSPQRAEHEYHSLAITIPLAVQGDVVINEIMAVNTQTAYDSNGESDDWIELYNKTNHAIDVSGLYLTDDIFNLMNWQIPAGTKINANDVLIIWADNDANQFGLHTNFKLSSTGESIILSNGSTIFDGVDYLLQTADISYARCPNGGATFSLVQPTFDALNNCVVGLNELTAAFSIKIYPVPAQNVLTFEGQDKLSVELLDMQGRLISHFNKNDFSHQLDISSWNAGCYITRLTAVNGQTQSVLFTKE